MFSAGTGPGQQWEQWPRSTPCSSLQPQHSRDGDKGLSLHAWLVGRNRTKLRPQIILLLGKRTERSVGWELAALGYTNKPFLQGRNCRGEDSLTHLPLRASSSKSAVYTEKLGLPGEDGAENPAPSIPKKKRGFSSSKAAAPTPPAGLGPTTAPSTAPRWDQGCSRAHRAQPTQQELGKN